MPESLARAPERAQVAADPRPCRSPQVNPEWWFPKPADVVTAQRAKQICSLCPLRLPCLAIALARNERFGIWGGTTERERRDLSRTRPCRGCGDPVALRYMYCGDACRAAGRQAVVRRYELGRRLRTAGGAS